MTIARVYPDHAEVADLDTVVVAPADRWLRLNLVASIDGSLVGSDGTSGSLTRGEDRRMLGAIRRASDVVLIGASSFRTESYLIPKTRPLAIVTASGDFSGSAALGGPETGRVFVLCPEPVVASVDLPGATVVGVGGDSTLAPHALVDALRELGFDSIVCEGGPTLAGSLLDAGLVDEVCLSTSPLLGGPAVQPFTLTRARQMVLCGLLVDDAGVSYARWTAARPATR